MAIDSRASRAAAARQVVLFTKQCNGLTASIRTPSLWAVAVSPPAGVLAVGNTTTGVLFDTSSTGAVSLDPLDVGETHSISNAVLRYRSSAAGVSIAVCLYDRIWGAGTISVAAVGTTTFSGTPSLAARQPANGGYESFELIAEFVTAVTGTAVLTVSYTNELGVSGRTATMTAVANSGYCSTACCSRFALQAGDRGVQSVQSFTVATAGTAGTVNLIVARSIAEFSSKEMKAGIGIDYGEDYLAGGEFGDGCCLWAVGSIATTSGTAVTGLISLVLDVIRG